MLNSGSAVAAWGSALVNIACPRGASPADHSWHHERPGQASRGTARAGDAQLPAKGRGGAALGRHAVQRPSGGMGGGQGSISVETDQSKGQPWERQSAGTATARWRWRHFICDCSPLMRFAAQIEKQMANADSNILEVRQHRCEQYTLQIKLMGHSLVPKTHLPPGSNTTPCRSLEA